MIYFAKEIQQNQTKRGSRFAASEPLPLASAFSGINIWSVPNHELQHKQKHLKVNILNHIIN